MKKTILAFIALLPLAAGAEILRFDFEGVVTGSRGLSEVAGFDGQPISGNYTFETTIENADPSRDDVAFWFNVLSFDVDIGGLEYSYTSEVHNWKAEILVQDNYRHHWNGSMTDTYVFNVHSDKESPIIGPTLDGLSPTYFLLRIMDTETNRLPDLLTDQTLPIVPPNINLADGEYSRAIVHLNFNDSFYPYLSSASGGVSGELTSLTKHSIPEPGSLALLGIGAGMLGCMTEKGKQVMEA